MLRCLLTKFWQVEAPFTLLGRWLLFAVAMHTFESDAGDLITWNDRPPFLSVEMVSAADVVLLCDRCPLATSAEATETHAAGT